MQAELEALESLQVSRQHANITGISLDTNPISELTDQSLVEQPSIDQIGRQVVMVTAEPKVMKKEGEGSEPRIQNTEGSARDLTVLSQSEVKSAVQDIAALNTKRA